MVLMGVAGNFFLNGLSFLAVLFALTRIRYPRRRSRAKRGMLTSLYAGLSYVRGRPEMFVLVWMIGVSSLLTIPFLTFIPYFARTQLAVGASGMGWLFGASGAGAVMGAATVAWLGNIRYRGRVIALSGASVMAIVVVFCYTHIFALSVFLMLLEGYGMILTISSVNVAMQTLSSDAMRGRVMSIYGTCFLGLPPLALSRPESYPGTFPPLTRWRSCPALPCWFSWDFSPSPRPSGSWTDNRHRLARNGRTALPPGESRSGIPGTAWWTGEAAPRLLDPRQQRVQGQHNGKVHHAGHNQK